MGAYLYAIRLRVALVIAAIALAPAILLVFAEGHNSAPGAHAGGFLFAVAIAGAFGLWVRLSSARREPPPFLA